MMIPKQINETSLIQSGGVRRDCEATATPYFMEGADQRRTSNCTDQ